MYKIISKRKCGSFILICTAYNSICTDITFHYKSYFYHYSDALTARDDLKKYIQDSIPFYDLFFSNIFVYKPFLKRCRSI